MLNVFFTAGGKMDGATVQVADLDEAAAVAAERWGVDVADVLQWSDADDDPKDVSARMGPSDSDFVAAVVRHDHGAAVRP